MQPDSEGWFPDPFGRFEYRWFDGEAWTATVGLHGEQHVDPEGVTPGAVPHATFDRGFVRRRVRHQVTRSGGTGQRPAQEHGLLDADVLVVNQKAKLVELSNEYMVYDEHGEQVGAVREVGQTTARKVVRALTAFDQYLEHRLELTDVHGEAVLRLTRPAKLLRSTVHVRAADGTEVGRLVQQNVVGKVRFAMEAAGGARVGMLLAENWRAWDFRVEDAEGREVARVHKTFEGLARALFTTADNYVVRVHRPLADPLRSLTVAAALCIDTALKQDEG